MALAAVLSKAASAIQQHGGVVERGSVLNHVVASYAAEQARLLSTGFIASLAARDDPQSMAKELTYSEGDVRARLNNEYAKMAAQLRENLHSEFGGVHECEIEDAVAAAERLLKDLLKQAWENRQVQVKKDLEIHYKKIFSGELQEEGWENYDLYFHKVRAKFRN